MKIDFKRKETKYFFRAFFLTLISIGCICGVYLGFCRSYEAIRKTCFGDDRSAVILSEQYIKFFDFEFYIPLSTTEKNKK